MNEVDEPLVIQLLYIPFQLIAAGKMNVSNEGYQCALRAFLSLKVINKLQMTCGSLSSGRFHTVILECGEIPSLHKRPYNPFW